MRKIGEILKSEREKKDLSLHEIGMSLKINPKILKAIEESDEKNLPAKTFLRGFIRSYAQYLRLDVEEILKQFQDELGSTRPAEPKNEATPTTAAPIAEAPKGNPSNQSPIEQKIIKPKKEKPLGKAKDENLNPSSSSRVFTIIGAIVLVLLIAFVAKMVEKYQKESVRHETQDVTTTTLPMGPSENLAAPNSADGGVVDGAPVAGISVPPKPTEMMTSAPIKATTTSTTTTTMKVTTTTTTLKIIAAVPKTTTTTTTSTSTTKVPRTTTTSTTLKPTATTTTLAAKKSIEVIVEALNKVSIKYTLGDDPAESLELNADQVHTFKSKDKITMSVSDGGAVNIIVNGRDRGVPGTIGQPIKLSYP